MDVFGRVDEVSGSVNFNRFLGFSVNATISVITSCSLIGTLGKSFLRDHTFSPCQDGLSPWSPTVDLNRSVVLVLCDDSDDDDFYVRGY